MNTITKISLSYKWDLVQLKCYRYYSNRAVVRITLYKIMCAVWDLTTIYKRVFYEEVDLELHTSPTILGMSTPLSVNNPALCVCTLVGCLNSP